MPYYFDENYITIRFVTTSPLSYFQGYLSVVKIVGDYDDGNCTITQREDVLYWSSVGDGSSYSNNVICNFNISIPYINQMVVVIFTYDLEEYVDSLRFYMSDKWVEISDP